MTCLTRGMLSQVRWPGSLQRAIHFHATTYLQCVRRRKFSVSALSRSDSDLFNYTSGRWLFNETLQLADRKRIFNVDGLCAIAAEAVNRSADEVVDIKKLTEGESSRDFLITMEGGFQLVARIPYHCTEPKYPTVLSEVATMYFMRQHGLPVPQVYLYSPTPYNPADTEYVIMSYLPGTSLEKRWFDLSEQEIIYVSRQIAQLERKMMEIEFPAGGSLYFTADLKRAGIPGLQIYGGLALPGSYSIGPDLQQRLWFGKRAEFPAYRGPYKTVENVLVAGAEKELRYLEQFGRPLLPLNRVVRENYNYCPQSPSEHIQNLERYLLIAPWLPPKEPCLNSFHIRHPAICPSNILVDANLKITGLLEWQHTSILPLFLLAGIPNAFQNYGDPVTDYLDTPVFSTENKDDWERADRNLANLKELYRLRLVHFHYFKAMAKHNPIHYRAWAKDSHHYLRRRLYTFSGSQWEGDPVNLKVALVEATENWKKLTGSDAPCPISFDSDDATTTKELSKNRQEAVKMTAHLNRYVGCASNGWVPNGGYEKARRIVQNMKEMGLSDADAEVDIGVLLETHWPYDNFDKTEYD